MTPELIRDLGLPIAIVAGGAWFFSKQIWPWVIRRTEVSESQATAAIGAFTGIEKVLLQHTDAIREVVTLLRDIKAQRAPR